MSVSNKGAGSICRAIATLAAFMAFQSFAQGDASKFLRKAQDFYRASHYESALTALGNALRVPASRETDSLIQNNAAAMSDNDFTPEQYASLCSITDLHPKILELLRYYRALRLYAAGKLPGARRTAIDFLGKYASSPRTAAMNELVDKIDKEQKETVQIGVLAPLSGNDADIGKQIVQGIQLAVEQLAGFCNFKIRLIQCDTRGDMLETARKARELIDEHRLPVIIGPMLSPDAIVAASMLVGKNIVMITPTATDDGIAALGENIFQMNVPLGVLGRRIAAYAVDNLSIRDFAILSPATAYGAALSKSFRAEAEKRGAGIVEELTYEEGNRDCGPQLDSICASLASYNERKNRTEGAEGDAPKSKRAASDGAAQLGGLFIPAEAEDAAMIAPQVQFHRLHTQLLGANGWHGAKTISEGKDYVNDAFFSTDSRGAGDSSAQWRDFSGAYQQRWGAAPERIGALGYDAASLVLRALKDNNGVAATAGAIGRSLAAVKNYRGVSGPISLDSAARVNTEAAIMKIKDNEFIRVQ